MITTAALQQLASEGDADSQFRLGYRFAFSRNAARRSLRRAARSGDAPAQRELGYCLHEGFGVRRDYDEAALWYRRAARQGESKAQFNLALCYLDGDGVPRSRTSAIKWLQRATKSRHIAARGLLRELAA